MIRISWSEGRWFPTLIKGGAMGVVDVFPVYAGGVSYPWRESELVWYFDPARQDWFPAAPMPLGRCYTTGCTAGDGLLVVGGRKTTAGKVQVLNDAWLLRRVDGEWRWTELPRLHQARGVAVVAVVGSRAVVAGGGDWERKRGGAFVASGVTKVEALDLTNLRAGWRDLGEPPFRPRASAAAAALGGSFYVFGGYDCTVSEGGDRHIETFDDAYRLDIQSGKWTQVAALPMKLRGHAALPFGDRYIVLAGGCLDIPFLGQHVPLHTLRVNAKRSAVSGGYSDLVLVYDAEEDRYGLLPDRLPHGLNDIRGCVVGSSIWLVGGESVDPTTSNTTDAVMIGAVSEEPAPG